MSSNFGDLKSEKLVTAPRRRIDPPRGFFPILKFPRSLVDRFSLSFQRSFLECLAECRVGMDHRAHVLKS